MLCQTKGLLPVVELLLKMRRMCQMQTTLQQLPHQLCPAHTQSTTVSKKSFKLDMFNC